MEPKDRGRVTRPAVISLSLCSVPESLEPPEGPAEEGRSGSTDTFPKGQIVGAGFLVFQHYLPQLLNSTGEVGEQLQGWLAAAGDLSTLCTRAWDTARHGASHPWIRGPCKDFAVGFVSIDRHGNPFTTHYDCAMIRTARSTRVLRWLRFTGRFCCGLF